MKNLHKKTQWLIGILILLCVSCGITFALLSQKSQTSVNNFTGGAAIEQKVNIAILENGETTRYEDGEENNLHTIGNGSYEKAVSIQNVNTTEYPTKAAYIRVRFVTALKNTSDAIYTYDDKVKVIATFSNSSLWKYDEATKTFYYTEKVAPDAKTQDLLKSVKVTDVPSAYQVEIKVLADAIEADQATMDKVWGMEDFNALQKLPTTLDLIKMQIPKQS